jgi:hypothetical protein
VTKFRLKLDSSTAQGQVEGMGLSVDSEQNTKTVSNIRQMRVRI